MRLSLTWDCRRVSGSWWAVSHASLLKRWIVGEPSRTCRPSCRLISSWSPLVDSKLLQSGSHERNIEGHKRDTHQEKGAVPISRKSGDRDAASTERSQGPRIVHTTTPSNIRDIRYFAGCALRDKSLRLVLSSRLLLGNLPGCLGANLQAQIGS